MNKLRSLWKRYLAWRVSGPPAPAPADGRVPLLKADVIPGVADGQSRGLSITNEGGS